MTTTPPKMLFQNHRVVRVATRKVLLLGVLLMAICLVGYYFHTPTSRQVRQEQDKLLYSFEPPADGKGNPPLWQLKVSTGNAWFSVEKHPNDPQTNVLRVRADQASFFLARNERTFDPRDFPILTWSWQATLLPRGGDVRKSSLNPFAENKNDQALQLLVTFENGNVISYMWDSTAPEGLELKENNPFANILSVVVESGDRHLGEWRTYKRNLVDDYRRLHGEGIRTVKAIAIQTNSNHTHSKSEGCFGPIILQRAFIVGDRNQ